MPKSIVVVGGGVFGVLSANSIYESLIKSGFEDIDVKLISASTSLFFLPSSVRLLTTADYSTSFTPLKKVVNPNVEVIIGKATAIDEKTVVLGNKEEINFDILVLATGSNRLEPISGTYAFGDDYKSHFEDQKTKISKAKSIVFIGGGFTNVEIAGELVEFYSKEIAKGEKTITIITNGSSLLGSGAAFTDKYRNSIVEFFKSAKVKLMFNSQAEIIEESDGNGESVIKKVLVNNKDAIEADLIYANTGIKPSVPSNSFKDFTNATGAVKINKTLQSTAVKNIFAIGDVSDFDYKGLLKAEAWSKTLGNNIINYLQDKPLQDTSLIDMSKPIMSGVSLGPTNGSGQLPFFFGTTLLLPKLLVVKAKSEHLLVQKLRQLEKY